MKVFFRMRLARAFTLLIGLMIICQTGYAAEWRRLEGGVAAAIVYNCNEWITLREYPNSNSASLARVPLGAVVVVKESDNHKFALVRYKGTTGWALKEYLTIEYLAYHVVNCNEWVSLRDEPSADFEKICEIPWGAEVRYVRDAESDFKYVAYKGKLGYVPNEYLE